MAVTTDFLLADQQQLATVFAGWLAVADQPISKIVKNPFTGQEQAINDWPTQGAVGDSEAAEAVNLENLTHTSFRRIDHVKLATLSAIVCGFPYEQAIAQLAKPALVHPTNEDVGLHELPEPLVAALVSLSDSDLRNTAGRWQQTEELQLDRFEVRHAAEVLEGLRSVAAKRQDGQGMFLFWSL